MILFCNETSLSLLTEISSIELEIGLNFPLCGDLILIPSMTELLSEISIVVGHECFNYYASLKGWMKLFIMWAMA